MMNDETEFPNPPIPAKAGTQFFPEKKVSDGIQAAGGQAAPSWTELGPDFRRDGREEGTAPRPINIISVRVGSKYAPAYVAILHDMAARNLSTLPQRHWCLTDDPDSLPDGVTAIPAHPDLIGWWQKPYLFSADMPFEAGARILYLDLDVAITGRLEEFAETKGIIRDWNHGWFNSSVMCWDHGEHRAIWERLDPENAPTRIGDQEWISDMAPDFPVLPADWCVSYRRSAVEWPPADSKVVVFHGEPKPHELTDGWTPQVWRIGGYTSLPRMTGANVEADTLMAQVVANSARDLPWFTGFGDQGRACVVVCGGPSLKDQLPAIRAHRQGGARIVSTNNALRFLLEHGIRPQAHVMLDGRAENANFVKDAPAGVRYFIASQCHPDLFEALSGRDVVVWHNAVGDGAPLRQALAPWWDERPIVMVPGGCTVGLRALHLAWLSGYRRIHVYGMDGSYSGEAHHAYPQDLNDGEATLKVVMGGKPYRCARWMVRQAEDFRNDYNFLTRQGVRISVHGEGLIPDMARRLRAAERQAA
ncbi:MAG: hypothetical protein JWM33_3524 [Caulobacteraceae bacterium]|nr:hypothetical protein [Caulobacteraceae bacterium]